MKLNMNLKATLALVAMTATFAACQSADDEVNNHPAGSIPLVLGEVSVGAPNASLTRATLGDTGEPVTLNGQPVFSTRAIGENAAGYTGIRKTQFVAGDVLALKLDDSATGGSTKDVSATLGADGKWSLGATPVYIQPGKTVITATHAGTEQQTGIATDDLAAAAGDCTVTASATGSLVSVAMKHAKAMVDVTPTTDGATVTSITLDAGTTTVKEDGNFRTILAVGSPAATISSLTAVINGASYVATLAAPLTVTANNRYPIALTFKSNTLTATSGTPEGWTNGGSVPNMAGYTRLIGTPEDLAQFAQDVNDRVSAAVNAVVLQTADIDISKLKNAADAGTNPLTGTAYTYTATADNWVPIGETYTYSFDGSYNGNGHIVSNVKFTTYPSDYMGLFGDVSGFSCLTGIHLRNFQALDNTQSCQYAGTLVGSFDGTAMTLCSATGTLKVTGMYIGGLTGGLRETEINRCTARVNIDAIDGGTNSAAGGLIGVMEGDCYPVACSSVSTITSTADYIGGFLGTGSRGPFGCYCGGTLPAGYHIFNGAVYDNSAVSCYSDMTAPGGFSAANSPHGDPAVYIACAYSGSNKGSYTGSGVTLNVTGTAAYTALVAGDEVFNGTTTLHWSPTDGYTLTEVAKDWHASKVWKDNGATANPTIDLTYEGE